MTTIDVTCQSTARGWSCSVRLGEPGAAPTRHEVTVTQADLDHLAPGATNPTDLVHRSFDFLLQREPPTSILRTFDLPAIGRYFPEYEASIRST